MKGKRVTALGKQVQFRNLANFRKQLQIFRRNNNISITVKEEKLKNIVFDIQEVNFTKIHTNLTELWPFID